MSSSMIDLENDLLSYANPNYHLTSDENSNVEGEDAFKDLCKDLDAAHRNIRKRIKNRRNYACLDPVSMGVDIDLETTPMLTPTGENYANQPDSVNSTIENELFQAIDNGNADLDSNDNEDIGRKPGFLDYYASLEAVSQKLKKQAIVRSVYATNGCVQNVPVVSTIEKFSGSSDSDKDSYSDISEEDLPSGWEKHEDESGPYYWHISSGTIQREAPIIFTSNSKTPTTKMPKEVDMISNKKDFSRNFRSSCVVNVSHDAHSGPMNVQVINEKLKRQSYPDASCSLTQDKRPIRFSVRSLGWVEIEECDLTPERSSKAVNKCIVDLSMGRNDILDVVGRWGDGKHLFMDLNDYSLRLLDTQDLTELNSQPIHTIRVWGVGRDNDRDFAYVARDCVTKKYMCHVFRCDIPAKIIANTLRDICKKTMIERSLRRSVGKLNEPISEKFNKISDLSRVTPHRPTNLPMEQCHFQQNDTHSSYTTQFFPTPMEEPKKILKVHYLGSTNVNKATGVDTLNDAIEKLSADIPLSEYKFVNVAVAPSTITISEPGEDGKQLAECRVRFLSFLGIGKSVKHCGFIVHTAQDEFIAHIFHCEPSSGALCKTIEAACKLRYQKCLDAHRQDTEKRTTEAQKKGLGTALKSVLGTFFQNRLTKSVEI